MRLFEGLLRMCMLAVEMQVQPGQSVALVGSSGGGKSTVVKVRHGDNDEAWCMAAAICRS